MRRLGFGLGFGVLLVGALATSSAALGQEMPTGDSMDPQVAAGEIEPVSLDATTDQPAQPERPSARERRLKRDPWRSGFILDSRQGLLVPLSPGIP
jgi:hypothetical protein